MIQIYGNYTNAIIMTDDVEESAISQIKQLCNLENMIDANIVCMPDCHPGKVSTIGFTCTQPYSNPIMPALVGNDIGCSVTLAKLHMKRKPEWAKLDTVIRENIPTGTRKRGALHRFYQDFKSEYRVENLHAKFDLHQAALSLGTLGGGNHFIEIDKDEDEYYITIHSGSRSFGAKVYDYWIEESDIETNGNGCGRTVARELTYLSNPDSKKKYIDDVQLCRGFAKFSHLAIIDDICSGMKWDYEIEVQSMHNIISDNIEDLTYTIRKGAIEAKQGDRVIIPINMKDGIIIGTSKGNTAYNNSAPHGAGRVLARKAVAEQHTLNEFKTVMNGIYSPTINKGTLDEAPFAYRSMEMILPKLKDIIDIEKTIKPVYNYKDDSGNKEKSIKHYSDAEAVRVWAKYEGRHC